MDCRGPAPIPLGEQFDGGGDIALVSEPSGVSDAARAMYSDPNKASPVPTIGAHCPMRMHVSKRHKS